MKRLRRPEGGVSPLARQDHNAGRKLDYVHSGNYSVAADGRTVAVSDQKAGSLHHSLIQWVGEPLSATHRSFQVDLLDDIDSQAGQFIWLGTNVATKGGVAMWDMHQSIRYRSLEGGVFTGGHGLHSGVSFGHKGDSILVYLEEVFEHKSLVNFFLNGTLAFRQFVKVDPGNLYPAIGMDKGPAKFYVTWPRMTAKTRLDVEQVAKTLSSWVGFTNFDKEDSTGILKLTQLDQGPRDGFSVQAPRPLGKDGSTYFKIELLSNQGSSSGPSIGLTPGFTSRFQAPGWKPSTIGYHTFDGKIYNECKTCSSMADEGYRRCVVGDRVGCGIIHKDGTKDIGIPEHMVLVYFTRNGQVVYTKPRFTPREGFYPTIGMCAIEEHVKVTQPCAPPSDLPLFDDIYTKWSPLYTSFRFSELATFLDYETHGTANQLCLDGYDRPTIVQCMKGHSDTCYFRVTIVEIVEEDCELQLGVANNTMATQGELLHNKTSTPALCLSPSKTHPVKIGPGDSIDIIIEKTERGYPCLLFIVNYRLVQRSCIQETTNYAKETLYPTICVSGGEVTLDVVWPDDKSIAEIKPDIVSSEFSHWMYPSCVTVNQKQMTLTHLKDQNFVCNVTSPLPLSKKGTTFFQLSYIPADTPSTPVFPGIGVTIAGFKPEEKLHLMVNHMWTVLFYATSQRLITWKGVKQADNQSENGESPTTVGCSAVYEDEKDVFRLTFYCNFHKEVTTEIDAKGPPGGYYPVFSFHKASLGHTFSAELLTVEAEDKLERSKQQLGIPTDPGPEKLYNWWDEEMSISETSSVSSEAVRERQSVVNNIYISHSASNTKDIQTIVQGLQQKGYAIQTTVWNTGEDKVMNLLMAQVVIFCLSPAAILDSAHKAEFDLAHSKNIPMLPVILKSIAWPPSGLYKSRATAMEQYTEVKLDFSGHQIHDRDIVHVERYLQKAIALAEEPIVLAPIPSDIDMNKFDGEVPDKAEYNPNSMGKSSGKGSRSCVVL